MPGRGVLEDPGPADQRLQASVSFGHQRTVPHAKRTRSTPPDTRPESMPHPWCCGSPPLLALKRSPCRSTAWWRSAPGEPGNRLGLELAGFEHDLSVELDPNAAATLRHSGRIERPLRGRSQSAYLRPVIVRWRGPAGTLQPRALMLENVRGLSLLRFAAYHQRVRDLLWTRPAVFSNVQSRSSARHALSVTSGCCHPPYP